MDVTFKTRLTKDGEAKETVASLNFDNVTPEQLHELAKRSVIIILQSQYRAGEHVPEVDEVDVAELFKREAKGKANPDKVKAAYAKLSPEEKAAVLAYLQNAGR